MKGFDPWYDQQIGKFLDNGKMVKLMGAKTAEEAVRKAITFGKKSLSKK